MVSSSKISERKISDRIDFDDDDSISIKNADKKFSSKKNIIKRGFKIKVNPYIKSPNKNERPGSAPFSPTKPLNGNSKQINKKSKNKRKIFFNFNDDQDIKKSQNSIQDNIKENDEIDKELALEDLQKNNYRITSIKTLQYLANNPEPNISKRKMRMIKKANRNSLIQAGMLSLGSFRNYDNDKISQL